MSTKVELNEDQKELLEKRIKDTHFLLATLEDQVKKGILEEDMKKTFMSCFENYFLECGKILNHESETAIESENRHKEIREANTKIYYLQKEIDTLSFGSLDLRKVSGYLGKTRDILKSFWILKGFNYIKDVELNGCLEVDFGVSFTRYFRILSDTPVSDRNKKKEWIDEISSIWDVHKKGDRDDWELLPTEKNIKMLTELFDEYLGGSIKDIDIKNYSNCLTIKSIKVRIRDSEKLKNLEKRLEKEFELDSIKELEE